MASIIKKGTNASVISIKGKNYVLNPGIITYIEDGVFNDWLNNTGQGKFFASRIISDKNPGGCFAVHKSSSSANSISNEIGEVKDASARIEIKTNTDESSFESQSNEIGEVKERKKK